jgi:hypothetical protein
MNSDSDSHAENAINIGLLGFNSMAKGVSAVAYIGILHCVCELSDRPRDCLSRQCIKSTFRFMQAAKELASFCAPICRLETIGTHCHFDTAPWPSFAAGE